MNPFQAYGEPPPGQQTTSPQPPVVHRNVAVLKVEDPAVFKEIRAVVELDAHVMGWISPTEAVLDPSRLKILLSALDARGLTPLVRRG